MGIAVVVPDGLEADDVLASAARFAPTVGARTVIMTSDRDAFALIDEHTRVLRIINGGVDASPLLTPDLLAVMLGIRPEQYRDYAALRGDPSDNLPGVRGVGAKTAARLLAELGSAAAVFDDLAAGGARVRAAVGGALAGRLAQPESRAAWELNCQVMRMHHDLDLGLDLGRGPGVLPLDAAAVSAAFRAHQLTWTTPAALQHLAYQEAAGTAGRACLVAGPGQVRRAGHGRTATVRPGTPARCRPRFGGLRAVRTPARQAGQARPAAAGRGGAAVAVRLSQAPPSATRCLAEPGAAVSDALRSAAAADAATRRPAVPTRPPGGQPLGHRRDRPNSAGRSAPPRPPPDGGAAAVGHRGDTRRSGSR